MNWAFCGSIAMAVAIILGAFGAHGLKKRLDNERLNWWQTGAQYHMIAALGLFAVASVRFMNQSNQEVQAGVDISGWLILLGIVFFSGSLYIMALTGIRKLGAITPIGGLLWIIGWIRLAMVTLT